MGRHSSRPSLILDDRTRTRLAAVVCAPREPEARVTRARVLLAYAGGVGISVIVRYFRISRARVVRILDQAMSMGVLESLEERRGRRTGSGRPPEAIAWLVALAERSPVSCGYPGTAWTMHTLVHCARMFGPAAGHPSLAGLSKVSAYRYFAAHGRPFRVA